MNATRLLLAVALLMCCPAEVLSLRVVPMSRRSTNVARPIARRHCTEPLMMAKKVTKVIKLAIPAGKANPAPPIGPALGAAGANIMMFCKEYNARTQDQVGTIVPVEISIFEDRSFTFILKTPPVTDLLKKAANVVKGSGHPGGRSYTKVGTVTMAQVV